MIGLAMIARNGASTMVKAIEPFLPIVDEISIVLGGDSEDETAEIASEYATVLSNYRSRSELPFHFGDCRQQSFNQMYADWAVVVDADDIWQGAEHLASFIDEAEQKEADVIYTLYRLNDTQFYQPRIYRRGVGQWVGAVHELYVMPPQTRALKTDIMSITQVKDRHRKSRAKQNIAIGEAWLERNPDDLRAIAHLIKDYLGQSDLTNGQRLCQRYFDTMPEPKPGHYDTEYLGVLQSQAEIALLTDDYDQAAMMALRMLQVRSSAAAWAILAEASQKMAHGSSGLLQLAVFAADQALFSGKPRDNQLYRSDLGGSIPCLIKAMALHELGDDRQALQIADLGRMIDPSNKQLVSVQAQLAERLNEAV